MGRLRRGLIETLAVVEERLRVRLHQAANRMEDADPASVTIARAGVRVLDAVDRVTHFRDAHRAERDDIPEGERRQTPAPRAERPEYGGLRAADLDTRSRARLRQRYRTWEARLIAHGVRPHHTDDAGGGHGERLPAEVRAELEPLWRAWRDELDAVLAARR